MRMHVPLCPCLQRTKTDTVHASPYSCKTGSLTKSGARLGSASPMILLSLPSMWRVTGMCVTTLNLVHGSWRLNLSRFVSEISTPAYSHLSRLLWDLDAI